MRDRGIGLNAREADKLFEAFYFKIPKGIAMDASDTSDTVYVGDEANNRIQKVDTNGP